MNNNSLSCDLNLPFHSAWRFSLSFPLISLPTIMEARSGLCPPCAKPWSVKAMMSRSLPPMPMARRIWKSKQIHYTQLMVLMYFISTGGPEITLILHHFSYRSYGFPQDRLRSSIFIPGGIWWFCPPSLFVCLGVFVRYCHHGVPSRNTHLATAEHLSKDGFIIWWASHWWGIALCTWPQGRKRRM